MKKINILLLGFCLFALPINAQKKDVKQSYTKFIDPMIGTAEHGHVFVGANVPFGAVQLGPTNIMDGWDWCSGYHFTSNTILGFNHTHLSGTGIGDMGDILVLPVSGNKVPLTKITKENLVDGYGSTFSHQNEVAKAGYYSVWLDKYKVKAELTASARVGFHKYTFSDNNNHILVDLTDGIGWDGAKETKIEKIDDYTIQGVRHSKGWAEDQKLFFVMTFSEKIDNFELFENQAPIAGNIASGTKTKMVAHFPNKKQVMVKVAISSVSCQNAILNLKAEIPHWNFDKTRQQADTAWNNEMKKIEIQANPETQKVFYTAMYHTLFAPSVFNDVNNDYLGTDKKVYKKANFTNYTTFSLWDTYRALHPLFTITQKDKINDIIQSFLAIYKQQGRLPIWHLMGNETNTMNGNHSIPVIVDAYFKGFRNYDVNLAFEAMKKTVTLDREGLDYVTKLQHIPADERKETVAFALEYAIDDWCIAQMAKDLGKTEDFEYFSKRANLYKLYFDAETQFMRGKRKDGSWNTPFDPLSSAHRNDDYVEGNAWQYTWLVPQDPYGLIKLFGSEEAFTKKLDNLFTLPEGAFGAEASPDISGFIGQYAQGNEPNHHIPYLYAFVGQPWKTADLIRTVANKYYTSKVNGLCGNEDLGQMSAWYIYSALGFYPVNPANGVYVFGTPLVDKAEIPVANGKIFTIIAQNNSPENKYIQKVILNGKPYTKSYINHQTIINGGSLTYIMGNKPSDFGTKTSDRPQ